MNKKFSESVKGIVSRIPESKRPLLIVIAGVLMLTLMVVPSFRKTVEPDSETPTENEQNNYINDTQNQLCELISSIEGAGKTKVFLTLESSEEKIYASDINGDKTEYVVIKENSDEGGMLLKIRKPVIRGVAVVCEGGDNPVVKVDIINAICSSLGVSSTRISIAKMKGRND